MKLVYENERGKVVMHGGGSAGFNIISISGLSIPENDVTAVHYSNMPGQVVTKSVPLERIITISADVRDENRKYISNAMKVFSIPGTVYITSSGKTKKIKCRSISFEPGKKRGSYIPFTIQLCADNPYFEDIYETTTNIYKKEKKLASPFVLGCVFSERIVKNNVINSGDVPVEPVFYITSQEGIECPNGITIKNVTNGDEIVLNTDIGAGETITVDIKNREIKSNLRGNIISSLAKDTSLSRFSLDIGISLVEVSSHGSNGKLIAVCKHNNSYVSVVI